MDKETCIKDITKKKLITLDPEYKIKKVLIQCTKNSARLKHLEHNITIEDLILPEYCPILEIKFNFSVGSMYGPTVDRIDNSKGYIKGNIKIISRLANTMKNAANFEELEKFSKNILEYIKK